MKNNNIFAKLKNSFNEVYLQQNPFLSAVLIKIENFLDTEIITSEMIKYLLLRNGASILEEKLPQIYNEIEIGKDINKQVAWEQMGLFYFSQGKYNLALPIFHKLS